jgi:hypothetical protein
MANSTHLFEDLQLVRNKMEVKRIGNGLEIKEKETFKFSLQVNKGRNHTIKIPSQTACTYLISGSASCCHNTGRRRQETSKHGWGIFHTSVCYIGKGDARKQYTLTHPPTGQSSTWHLPLVLIAQLPLPLRLSRLHTTTERLSFNIPGAGTWTMSPGMFMKSLLLKKT